MKRTRGWNTSLAPIVSDFLRVGMWPIITPLRRRIDPDTGIMKTIYRYGEGKSAGVIVVDGELRETDRGTFLIISSLDEKTGYTGINGDMIDLVEIKFKRPDHKSSIYSTWESVERLLNVSVRIKPNRLGGSLSAGFKLVTGYINSDGSFFLTSGDYHRMIESLNLYEYKIVLPKYLKERSSVTRSLKVFLENQQWVYSEKGYHRSLQKLCTYIGYSYEGREWKDLWRYVEKAMNRLKEEGFLYGKSSRDTTKMSNEGGLISFWARRQYED